MPQQVPNLAANKLVEALKSRLEARFKAQQSTFIDSKAALDQVNGDLSAHMRDIHSALLGLEVGRVDDPYDDYPDYADNTPYPDEPDPPYIDVSEGNRLDQVVNQLEKEFARFERQLAWLADQTAKTRAKLDQNAVSLMSQVRKLAATINQK